jgi:hypothetical protein
MQTKRNNLILTSLFLMLFVALPNNASAQEQKAPEGYQYVDSLVYVRVSQVDSTYMGVDVFDLEITQSEAIERSMRNHIKANPGRNINGYRVRIFFDNKQTARTESEKTLKKFEQMFPDILAYRTYTNPYFKVTVGDCRTKSEAMALLGRIKVDFPSAFVVKENISFPVLDPEHAYDIDTVKVLRPLVLPDAVPVL